MRRERTSAPDRLLHQHQVMLLRRRKERALREEAARMCAIVAHDLRNPLGAIELSASRLLKTSEGVPGLKKPVETIQRAARRMEGMISDLLDLAAIQVGRLTLEVGVEQLGPVIADATAGQAAAATAKQIALTSAVDLGDVRVTCDRDRLWQVLDYVIASAIEQCPPETRITVRGHCDGKVVRIEVTDDGPGISATDLPHVFDAYWQARGARKTSGIRMYIARGIVVAHGGTITATSAPDAGTTITFTLPISHAG